MHCMVHGKIIFVSFFVLLSLFIMTTTTTTTTHTHTHTHIYIYIYIYIYSVGNFFSLKKGVWITIEFSVDMI